MCTHLIQYAYFNLHLLSYINMSQGPDSIEWKESGVKGCIPNLRLFAIRTIRRNSAFGILSSGCAESGVLEKYPAGLPKEALCGLHCLFFFSKDSLEFSVFFL